MYTHKGTIPESINVTLRDVFAYSVLIGEVEARAAFITDPASLNGLKTAASWAQGGPYSSPGIKGATKTPEVLTIYNRIIPEVLIVGSEDRSEGSHTWKAILEGSRYDNRRTDLWFVDLRDDVFYDAIRAGIVHSNGKDGLLLAGAFRWVKLGTQMRLALVDSQLYRDLEGCDEKRTAPPKPILKSSTLEIGGLYIDTRGDHEYVNVECFLGKVRYDGRSGFATCHLGCVTAPKYTLDSRFQSQGNLDTHRSIELKRSAKFTQKVGQLTVDELMKRVQTQTHLAYQGKYAPDHIQFEDGQFETYPVNAVEWV